MTDTHIPSDTTQFLRAAAQKLREHVDPLYSYDIRGPWYVHTGHTGYPQAVSNVGVPIHIADTFTDPKAPPVVANYIALMHPGVGDALAIWFESLVTERERVESKGEHIAWSLTKQSFHAVRVARQILGSSDER